MKRQTILFILCASIIGLFFRAIPAEAEWRRYPSLRTWKGHDITDATGVAASMPIARDIFSVFFIDVGQGDSILIKTNRDNYILIDSGPSDAGNGLNAFLSSKGVTSIYRLILTHPDFDHYGEFEDVIGSFAIGGFIYTNYPVDKITYDDLLDRLASNSIPLIEVRDGDSFVLDNLTFNFYHPPVSGFINTSADENDNSLVIKISNRSGTDLFIGGDLEAGGIESLLSRHDDDIDVELSKVNHHGGSSGTSQELLDATTPVDVFICVGANNNYGMPNDDTLALLESNGINIYRTDQDGDITVDVNRPRFARRKWSRRSAYRITTQY